MTKRARLFRRLPDDLLQADRGQPKQRSRCNAIRHGLTAETVIGALEEAEDYQAFETAITADYDAWRLASLLWRLRRASTIETGLFEIQADRLTELRRERRVAPDTRQIVYAMFEQACSFDADTSLCRQPANQSLPVLRAIPRPTLRVVFCAWPICPTSHSIVSPVMKQLFGVKPVRSSLLSMH